MPDELLTVGQAAEELGRPRRTVLDWIQNGRLNATKIGGGRTSAYVLTRDVVDEAKINSPGRRVPRTKAS